MGTDKFANPEPIINAVLAALEAQHSAYLTNWLLTVLLVGAALVLVAAVVGLAKISAIEAHTNGMHGELLVAARKLALIEGEVIGRAKQTIADKETSA